MDMVAMIINMHMDDMEAMEDMATDMVRVMGEVMAMVEDMTTIKDMIMETIKATIMVVMEDIKAMEAIIKAGMAKEQF